jgi:DNA-binding LytR/AlgR family response regulator
MVRDFSFNINLVLLIAGLSLMALKENSLPVDKIKKSIPESLKKIMIKGKKDTTFILEKDIFFVEKEKNLSILHCRGEQSHKTKMSLKDIESELGEGFLRLHRSYIVNIKLINKIIDLGNRSYSISFQDTTQTALMSRYKYQEYKTVLAQLIQE